MKHIHYSLLLTLLLAPGLSRAQYDPFTAAQLSFTILQLNDIYEIAPLRGSDEGGLARVATIRRQLLKDDPNTLTVLAGDFVSPSLIGTLYYLDPTTRQEQKIAGRHMIDVLNKMGLDYVTFGNHEFDIKFTELQDRMNESRFAWVSSNVYRLSPNGRSQLAPPCSIRTLTFPGGQILRVGFIGSTISFNKADSIGYDDGHDHQQGRGRLPSDLSDQYPRRPALDHRRQSPPTPTRLHHHDARVPGPGQGKKS